MSEPVNESKALQYCIDQIRESDRPGSEVVIGAMALWIAAHGDFELPQPTAPEHVIQPDNEIVDRAPETLPAITSPALARVSFGDVVHREMPVLTDEAIYNTVDFKNALTATLAPYIAGVNAKVQHADKLTGLKKTGEYTWQDQQTLDNQLANVFFKARYKSHETHNEALGLEVAYTQRRKPHKRDLRIILNFQNGGVHTLGIKDFQNSRGASLSDYNAPNLLPKLLATKTTSASNHIYMPEGAYSLQEWGTAILGKQPHESSFTHWFRLQDDIPTITSSNKSIRIRRTFDPHVNGFRGIKQESFKKLPETSEYIMSSDLVVSFVEGLLASLPRQDDTRSMPAIKL